MKFLPVKRKFTCCIWFKTIACELHQQSLIDLLEKVECLIEKTITLKKRLASQQTNLKTFLIQCVMKFCSLLLCTKYYIILIYFFIKIFTFTF